LARLQQQIGNREVVRLLGAQTRLDVGRADDPLEIEADRAAAEVVRALRTSDPGSSSAPTNMSTTEETLRRRSPEPVGPEGGELSEDVERSLSSARTGGTPVPEAARDRLEGAFGADFTGVRLHAGPAAADLSRQMGATAFTIGRDIFFRDGVPDTGSSHGQHLLAHELAHTVQQGGAPEADSGDRIQRVEDEELEDELE
jgi:hypothetical protein